jgi:hypothetical protein
MPTLEELARVNIDKHSLPTLTFSNEDMAGGFIAQHADTGELYPSHECYLDGILCYADEGHFGGIVIQPV